MLRGRSAECESLDALVEAVLGGESRTLLLHGEAGIGKSALLDYLVARASGCRVIRAAGVQSEMELAFATLHLLCAPMLDRLDQLPEPQADALRTAFGMRVGPVPDRFLVGLAVLTLLAEVAEVQPLICVIDDAQWLDLASAQALAFVARRLFAESVGLVFAARDADGGEGLHTFVEPHLVVRGLRDADARALLGSVISGPLDERVRDRIVAETGGNPLALLELPRGLGHEELAGGFGLPVAPTLSGRIEESFLQRVERLPRGTRWLLLVAAAEPVGDPVLLWRAVERLGLGGVREVPLAAADLLEIGAKVRFRHPLVRSAVYRAARPQDRLRVHLALAEATDPELDPDRRAWHRAHATPEPDEDVAAELERSAGRAQARGGMAAAAAFLERAAKLTPEAAPRAERALAAAQAKHDAGSPDAALGLLAAAQTEPLDELQRARVDLLQARVAFTVSRGNDAPPLLLSAAKRLEALDVTLARDTYLEALSSAVFAGRLAGSSGLAEVAEAARAAPPGARPPRAADLLLDGLALLLTDGHEAGQPILRRALSAFGDRDVTEEEELRWLWLAGISAAALWDDETWRTLATRHVELALRAGALAGLPLALSQCVIVHLQAGELAAAASLVEESETVNDATGNRLTPYGALALAAWRGSEANASGLIETSLEGAVSRNEGMGLNVTHWSRAVLYNGLGRYPDALAAAQQVGERAGPARWTAAWALVELIEAATRSGRPELVADALARLSETTRPSGTDWGLGIEARSRALAADGDVAEALYREAIERLGRTRVRVELARTHLLYGEWLRRRHRRVDARSQLRTAHELFTTMGVDAFGKRAERELAATGETARRRTVETLGDLTAQEAQIARLARDGLTNPEIGARLFISPRTVQYHLHKVFGKLGVSSRVQLQQALA